MRSLILALIIGVIFIPTQSFSGTQCATINDAKDALVVAARNSYNSRTGQSLTTGEYLREIIRSAVVGELKMGADENAQDTFFSALSTNESNAQTDGSGWQP